MQSDLNTYKTTLDQHSNANAQIRSLQEKANRDKHEFEEVLFLLTAFFVTYFLFIIRNYVKLKIDIKTKLMIGLDAMNKSNLIEIN